MSGLQDPGPNPGAYRLTVVSIRHFVTAEQVETTIRDYLQSDRGRMRFDERQYRISLHESKGTQAVSHTFCVDEGMQIETVVKLEPAQ